MSESTVQVRVSAGPKRALSKASKRLRVPERFLLDRLIEQDLPDLEARLSKPAPVVPTAVGEGAR
jgi:hypothetical protein